MPAPAPVIAPGPTTYINFLEEARVGVYAHNWIHDEGRASRRVGRTPVQSDRLRQQHRPASGSAGFFNPRINIGAMINTEGKTSYGLHRPHLAHSALQGVLLRRRCSAAAVNTSPLRDEPDRVNTGCRWDFRESGGFGYQFQRALGRYRQCRAHLACEACAPTSTPGLTQVRARGSGISSSAALSDPRRCHFPRNPGIPYRRTLAGLPHFRWHDSRGR